MKISRSLIQWLLLLLFAISSSAQQSIHGFIRENETGEPLPYANVILPELNRGATSNVEGYFVVSDLPVGAHQLVVSIIGYSRYEQTIELPADLNLRLDVRLDQAIIEGQSIEVSAEREKFKELVSTSTVTLDRRAIEVAPSFVEADVFRALQLLPGVQSLNDFSSALYVRGSTPDQNLIMLDGITVYNPMHLGGIFSTFNTDAIKEADFHAGGFPAQYGGRLGSILNIVNREGNTEELTGSANISLISSKALIEGPLPTGNSEFLKGSWMLAGRRTYFDVVANTLYKQFVLPRLDATDREDSPENIFPYYFYDFQGKVNLDVGSNHRLTWSSFHGDDVLKWDYQADYSSDDWEDEGYIPDGGYYYEGSDSSVFDWRWGNFTNSLSWRWIVSPKLIARTFIANSRFRFAVDFDYAEESYSHSDFDTSSSRSSFGFDLFDRINDNSVESNLTWLANDAHNVLTGFQHKEVHFKLGMILRARDTYNGVTETFRDTIMWMESKPVESAWYIQDQWKMSPLLSLQTGLRVASYSLHDTTYFEPRLGLKYFLSEKVSLKASVGRYHQFLTVANPPDENLRFLDIWFGIPEDRPAPRSDHYILGIEYLSDSDILIRTEAYHKSFDNLLTLKPTDLIAVDAEGHLKIDPFNEFWETDAYAQGLEILVKKLSGKVRGWAGYTYAQTKRKYEGQDWYFPKYDRTHTLNVVADWSLNEALHFSTAITYSSGNPYTAVIGRTETWTDNSWDLNDSWYNRESFLYGERHGQRYPGYFRWDVSFKKRKPFLNGHREWYFQILNVTNHLNVFSYLYRNHGEYNYKTYEYENKGVQRFGIPMFPFFPTFGVKFEF
ncbi:MAG: TonB-dependent receptor [Candidatus Marinimicrobia bacterium]|jgi:outer membrane cobalamin receptor|nr:TonB-dependent receptor [Candidatus Neomarinimicrobiota bacterium]MBT3632588.1 TonB-dependent receptor [Candidatus Neomarinimicrobiota bacterium]MBT3824987.1 TonB-dependent receptor [Candidatus Neomarinimicrobiota bacterium]MBT4129147.1 TonB-dependent receptor [Candidatus Neomarinimicrobiota bacterium]MBT4295222.1 TonB-dependent receptor [Candidatus Neomarinimicrobiota bacterium]